MATTTQTPFPTSPSSSGSSTSSSPGSSSSSGLGSSSSSGSGSTGSTSSGSAASLGGGSTGSGLGGSGAGSSGSMGGSTSSMDSAYGTSGRSSMSESESSMGRNERMDRVVQSAHQAVDTLAAKAAPLVDRFSSSIDGASGQMHDRADQLTAMQEEWVESARTTVREHPLASLAAAVAVGMLISRLSR